MKSTRSTRDRSGSSLVEAEILTKTSALYTYRRCLFTVVLLCSVIATQAQSLVTLAWDRNSETNIAGYRLYCGTVPSVYTNVINVGNVTTASVSNLAPGVTYRFAVTAFNTQGGESDYSSEIAFTTTNIVTPNNPPTLTGLANLSMDEDAGTQTVLLTGIGSGGESQTLTVTASATPQALIPSVSTVYTSPRTTGTVSFVTAPNASGTGVVNVTVSDGLAQVVRSFTVTVNPVNDAPTIANIADRTIDQNTGTGPIGFVIGDAETPAASLVLSASSSNPSLVPNQNIVFGGSGSSRTVTVTPATDQTGTATINISVSDGVQTASDSWILTVSSTPTTNTPPVLSSVRSTSIFSSGSSFPIRFSVSDAETAPEALQVSAVSSNPGLIPDGNVAFQGTGLNRTLAVTAANAVGSATITLNVNDGSGNTRSTNFGVSVLARPAQLVYLPFEAEDGSVVSPMQVDADASATYVTTSSANQGTVSFQVSITQPGNYIIWARHLSPSSGRDSFFVSVDGVEIPYATAIGTWSSDWQWTRVTVPAVSTQDPRVLSLSAGNHTVTFRGSEPNCFLDRIVICNDLEYVPGVGGNTAPGLSSFAARTIDEDTSTGPMAFTVSDAETPGSLVINATSSNPSLVPSANMTIGGTGTDRTLTVTPALNQSGTATITVMVSDGSLSATRSFLLTVTSRNDAPTLTSIANSTTVEDTATLPIAFTVGDAETSAGSLTLSSTSANPTLVPNGNVVFGGSGASRTVRVTPAPNQFGTASINVWVSDGAMSSTRIFQVTVVSSNDPPTMGALVPATAVPGTLTALQPVVIADIDTAASSLVVTGTSSDTNVLPNANILLGTLGLTRTLSVRPLQTGAATVTLRVSDGVAQSTQSFLLTVANTNGQFTLRPSYSVANSGYTISWDSRIGYTYRVMTKTSLTQTTWIPLINIRATNATTSWTDLNAGQRRFGVYQIEMSAPIGFEN